MKSLIKSFAIGAALLAASVPAMAQTHVSIHIGQPGFYGRLDLDDFGRPPVMQSRPIIVQQARYRTEPIYLRVPNGHRKNWSRYCGRYNACARPVLFVRDDWYTNTYAPRYRERHHGYRAERQQVEYREHDRRDRDDRHDKHQKHDKHDKHDKHGRGNGNGHGNGHGRGH